MDVGGKKEGRSSSALSAQPANSGDELDAFLPLPPSLPPTNDSLLDQTNLSSLPSPGLEPLKMANAVGSSSNAVASSSKGGGAGSGPSTDALRPLYEESSQYRNWRYSKEQLAKMRKDLNERAVETVRKNLQAEKVSSTSPSLLPPSLPASFFRSSPIPLASLFGSCSKPKPKKTPTPPALLQLLHPPPPRTATE